MCGSRLWRKLLWSSVFIIEHRNSWPKHASVVPLLLEMVECFGLSCTLLVISAVNISPGPEIELKHWHHTYRVVLKVPMKLRGDLRKSPEHNLSAHRGSTPERDASKSVIMSRNPQNQFKMQIEIMIFSIDRPMWNRTIQELENRGLAIKSRPR